MTRKRRTSFLSIDHVLTLLGTLTLVVALVDVVANGTGCASGSSGDIGDVENNSAQPKLDTSGVGTFGNCPLSSLSTLPPECCTGGVLNLSLVYCLPPSKTTDPEKHDTGTVTAGHIQRASDQLATAGTFNGQEGHPIQTGGSPVPSGLGLAPQFSSATAGASSATSGSNSGASHLPIGAGATPGGYTGSKGKGGGGGGGSSDAGAYSSDATTAPLLDSGSGGGAGSGATQLAADAGAGTYGSGGGRGGGSNGGGAGRGDPGALSKALMEFNIPGQGDKNGKGGKGAADSQGEKNPLGSEDPEDYLKRMGLGEDIFKRIEYRYHMVAFRWGNSDHESGLMVPQYKAPKDHPRADPATMKFLTGDGLK